MAGVRVVQPDLQPGERTPEIDTEAVVGSDGVTRQRQVIAANPDTRATGTLSAVGAVLEVAVPYGTSGLSIQLTGTFSAGSQVVFEATTNGTDWFMLNCRLNVQGKLGIYTNMLGAFADGPGPQHWRTAIGGIPRFRVRCSALTAGDAIAVSLHADTGVGGTFLLAPLPSGDSFIGYSGTYEERAVEVGLFRWSGGKAQTSIASPNASLTLTNPTGSLRDIIMTRFSVEVDADADVVYVHEATSSGELRPAFNPNHLHETDATYAEVRIGAGVLTGGTQLSMVRRATTSSPVAVGPFEWRIQPGHSWSVMFVGPGATNNVYFNIGWFEVDLNARLL